MTVKKKLWEGCIFYQTECIECYQSHYGKDECAQKLNADALNKWMNNYLDHNKPEYRRQLAYSGYYKKNDRPIKKTTKSITIEQFEERNDENETEIN